MPETEKIEEPEEEEEVEEPIKVEEPEPTEIPLPEKIKTSNLEDDLGILEKKDNFIELDDTPDDYNWQSGKLVRVEKITYSKEDILNDYTETDPGTSFTVYLNKVAFNEATNNENGYVYKDKGADHFSSDFEHKLTVCITAQDSTALINLWALANMVGDQKAIMDASKRQLNLSIYKAPANPTLRIYERNGASQQNDSFGIEFDKKYYLTIKRDESIGTYGRLYVYVYSNAERTDLLDTLQLDLGDKTDYQYIYVIQTYNTGSATESTGYVEDLCLIETQPTKLEFAYLTEVPSGLKQGDILYHDGEKWTRLEPGTSGKYLKTLGVGANPIWGVPNFIEYKATDDILFSADTQGATASEAYVKVKEIKVMFGVKIRVSFDLYCSGDSMTAYGRVYINGSPVGTERITTSTTPQTYTQDFDVGKTDLIQLYCKRILVDGVTRNTNYQNFRVKGAMNLGSVITD